MTRLALGLLVVTGCAIDGDVADLEATREIAECPRFGCGTNTATGPDGIVFDEFDWTGALPNPGGVYFGPGMLGDGITPVRLSARRDQLIATDGGGTEYTGTQLNGTIITMSLDSGRAIEVLVADVNVNGVRFWAGDTSQIAVYYDLKARWSDDTEGFKHHLCNNEGRLGSGPWETASHAALIFEGDRYNTKFKRVVPSPGEPWLNIACAGSYPAEMHLLRHTAAGAYDPWGNMLWPTLEPARTTMLKALTADYFGDGRSYTITGHALRWSDAAGIKIEMPMPLGTGAYAVEAIWNDQGIVCLDTPRLYPRHKVDPGNKIPHCSLTDWNLQGYVVTGTPPSP